MQEEQWFPLKGLEDSYECSTLGRLRSKDRVWHLGANKRIKKGQIKKIRPDGSYFIQASGRNKTFLPEELKAMAEAAACQKNDGSQ